MKLILQLVMDPFLESATSSNVTFIMQKFKNLPSHSSKQKEEENARKH